ncbi:LysR family transcriptional regulator [Nakamurella aerolata]|uniref:LysR family transcriptional regulator n=1 Tax=Nakamurella aerolata TaxID=1656892 RepID=A0A849AGI1_9ACTN|nr:LysR family transcriptional regulator [Nakamurella aerolata]NNG37550.1 LysR family transcriptional regulator [Nakamurella aerolata]
MDREAAEAFVALARSGHYGDAASALLVSQPALTRRIQRLESALGVRLFDRGRHGARLSVAGRELAPLIDSWVDADDRLLRQAGLLEHGVSGTLRLGFGMSSVDIAPQAVARYRHRFPGVAVTLDDMSSTQQLDLVESGQLDAGFVRTAAAAGQPQLRRRQVGRDRLALARAVGARNAAATDLLTDRPVIALEPERGPGLYRQITEWLRAHGLTITVGQRAHDLLTVLALVAADAGIAVVPASSKRTAPRGVRITHLPSPAADWTISLVWRADSGSVTLREFLAAQAEPG